LRIRSYVVFHRIYESMVLGMHPVFAYLRRSRVAPLEVRWIVRRRVSTTRRYDSAVSQPTHLL